MMTAREFEIAVYTFEQCLKSVQATCRVLPGLSIDTIVLAILERPDWRDTLKSKLESQFGPVAQ